MGTALVFNGPEPQVDDALRWAARLVDHTGDDLVVLNVDARLAAGIDDEVRERVVQERRQELSVVASTAGCPGAAVEVLDGELPQALLQRAAGADPAWLVVGQHGAGDVGGLRSHATADHLIHHLARPVVVVNDGTPWRDGPVVVGLDGSTANAAALRIGVQLARACERQVVGVFVYDDLADSFPHPSTGWRYPHEVEVRAELGALLGTEVRLELVGGHPVEELNRFASAQDALAIVVGTRGRGGFRGLVAGRVPVQLIRHATTAAVVVPHAEHVL